MTKTQKKLWTGLIVMALLSPLGIILPELFQSGDAWGEWGTDTLETLLGFVPEGLRKYAELWKAPIQDYNLGGEGSSMTVQVISYVLSGILGILVVAGVIYLISRVVVKHEK
jgi:hypothetical protein